MKLEELLEAKYQPWKVPYEKREQRTSFSRNQSPEDYERRAKAAEAKYNDPDEFENFERKIEEILGRDMNRREVKSAYKEWEEGGGYTPEEMIKVFQYDKEDMDRAAEVRSRNNDQSQYSDQDWMTDDQFLAWKERTGIENGS